MDQFAAMRETLTRAQECGMAGVAGLAGGCDYWHLQDMVERVEIALSRDATAFSEAKLGRWLGWMQCAVVAAQVGLSLDDMKSINRFHGGDAK